MCPAAVASFALAAACSATSAAVVSSVFAATASSAALVAAVSSAALAAAASSATSTAVASFALAAAARFYNTSALCDCCFLYRADCCTLPNGLPTHCCCAESTPSVITFSL